MSRGKNSTPLNMRRGNKPLAWYISEKLMDKESDRETPSPSGRANSVNRKSSMESQASNKPILPSSFPSDPIVEDRKKKNNGKKNQRPRTKRLSANFSFASPHDQTGVARDLNSASDKSHSSAGQKEKKEDYWYYDPVSDGFYYEHNGSRGWRRRNPKLHGIPMPMKPEETEQQKLIAAAQLAAAQNQNSQNPQNTAKLLVNQNVANPVPSMKYDPNTDGFFYEMASVDGWKRRQPTTGTTPPRESIVHPRPMNMPPPPMLPPFHLLPSFLQPSMLNAQGSRHLVIPQAPVQDSNSTTPQAHALSHAELEDMVTRLRNEPDNGYCGSVIEGSNGAGNAQGESMLNKSRLSALQDEFPSNASTTSSISDDMVTPPPPSSRHHSFLRTIHQNSQRSRAMNIDQTKSPGQFDNAPQSKITVGSYDESYWSDTDKAPSVCSVDENAPVSQDLMSYFSELTIKPSKVEAMPFDTFRARTGSNSMKRPNSLNIGNANANNNNAWTRCQNFDQENTQSGQNRFNVDKFIEDLPPFFNDNILNSLYALRTPSNEQVPLSNDSSLFTPVVNKENVWKMGPGSSKDTSGPSNIPHFERELTSADIGGNPFLLNDLERIWQWPAA